MEINGQVALVTGGASGLGEATARHLSSQGAKVTIVDFSADKAQSVASEISGLAVACDVADEQQVAEAISASQNYWGQPARIIVNCAGIAPAARIVGREGKLSCELYQKVISVNLIGSYYVMSYAAKAMIEADIPGDGNRGVIINTSSIAYEDGQIGQSAYAASKGGIASMCLPAARELAQHAIRVMAIAPGLFHTPLMDGLPEETVSKITENVPFPDRLGIPEEFAKLVHSIIKNDYLNGSVIRLDGAARLPVK